MFDIGIRREDKNRWERRAPLIPDHVRELVNERGLTVAVQPSPLRIFADEEYRDAGATITGDLQSCRVILGVKEVPPQLLLFEKPYLFFSHVIKGQATSMPLLREVIARRCTLIDYEQITDRLGRRLIFFGRHAGYAGMIDALWALGRRMAVEGVDTALASVEPAHAYNSVDEAAEHLTSVVARRIREQGVRPEIHPFVVGFTGGGNVSQGAQEIFGRLPVVDVQPDDLPQLMAAKGSSRRAVYKVVFRRDDRRDFARHLPCLTILINGIYWEPVQPRLVTIGVLDALWSGSVPPKLKVIADISCDVGGSVAATVRTTTPDDPVYVFDPKTGVATSGVAGHGPVVLAVDNLPAELPRDASEHFGDSLVPFVTPLLGANFDDEFEFLTLPSAVAGAVIVHRGELTPRYRYLAENLR